MEPREPGLANGRVKMESRRLGQASARGSNIPRAGPGAVGPARPGLAVPHQRQLAPPANTVRFEISEFLQFENITKRVTFFWLFSLELTLHGS